MKASFRALYSIGIPGPFYLYRLVPLRVQLGASSGADLYCPASQVRDDACSSLASSQRASTCALASAGPARVTMRSHLKGSFGLSPGACLRPVRGQHPVRVSPHQQETEGTRVPDAACAAPRAEHHESAGGHAGHAGLVIPVKSSVASSKALREGEVQQVLRLASLQDRKGTGMGMLVLLPVRECTGRIARQSWQRQGTGLRTGTGFPGKGRGQAFLARAGDWLSWQWQGQGFSLALQEPQGHCVRCRCQAFKGALLHSSTSHISHTQDVLSTRQHGPYIEQRGCIHHTSARATYRTDSMYYSSHVSVGHRSHRQGAFLTSPQQPNNRPRQESQ